MNLIETLEIKQDLYKPIPSIREMKGFRNVPLEAIDPKKDPLVPLGPFSPFGDLHANSIYFAERGDSPYQEDQLKGALLTIFVRKTVAVRLRRAQKLLPEGFYLEILDGYRSVKLQQSFYNEYLNELRSLRTEWNEEQLADEAQKYVSTPSKDPRKPSTHNTGGSVDLDIVKISRDVSREIQKIDRRLSSVNWRDDASTYPLSMRRMTLISQHAERLNFGAPFDWGGEESALGYYESLARTRDLSTAEEEALVNRRLLFNVLRRVGFQGYPYEWWHFNALETQMGVWVENSSLPWRKVAKFGPMELSSENRRFEQMRQEHRLGHQRILAGWQLGGAKSSGDSRLFDLVKKVGREVGDISRTTLEPKAAIISPQ